MPANGGALPWIGSDQHWSGGPKTPVATCVLGPNPSPMTLDGTNTWILRGNDAHSCVVVDPGPDDDQHCAAILSQAEAMDASIDVILLTHGHSDHSALARRLAGITAAPVRAIDPMHRLGDEGLDIGDVVQAAGLEIEVVAAAGHTADSVCFWLPSDASLLTGDTVLGRGTTVVAWPDGRLGDYLLTLQRLRDLVDGTGVDALLPGHGPLLDSPADILDAYLDHRRARLDEVRAAVAAGCVQPADVVRSVYADIPPAVIPAAELSVRAQLAYLADRGELPPQ